MASLPVNVQNQPIEEVPPATPAGSPSDLSFPEQVKLAQRGLLGPGGQALSEDPKTRAGQLGQVYIPPGSGPFSAGVGAMVETFKRMALPFKASPSGVGYQYDPDVFAGNRFGFRPSPSGTKGARDAMASPIGPQASEWDAAAEGPLGAGVRDIPPDPQRVAEAAQRDQWKALGDNLTRLGLPGPLVWLNEILGPGASERLEKGGLTQAEQEKFNNAIVRIQNEAEIKNAGGTVSPTDQGLRPGAIFKGDEAVGPGPQGLSDAAFQNQEQQERTLAVSDPEFSSRGTGEGELRNLPMWERLGEPIDPLGPRETAPPMEFGDYGQVPVLGGQGLSPRERELQGYATKEEEHAFNFTGALRDIATRKRNEQIHAGALESQRIQMRRTGETPLMRRGRIEKYQQDMANFERNESHRKSEHANELDTIAATYGEIGELLKMRNEQDAYKALVDNAEGLEQKKRVGKIHQGYHDSVKAISLAALEGQYINPETKKPYTPDQINSALGDIRRDFLNDMRKEFGTNEEAIKMIDKYLSIEMGITEEALPDK